MLDDVVGGSPVVIVVADVPGPVDSPAEAPKPVPWLESPHAAVMSAKTLAPEMAIFLIMGGPPWRAAMRRIMRDRATFGHYAADVRVLPGTPRAHGRDRPRAQTRPIG